MWRSRLSGMVLDETYKVGRHKIYAPETGIWQFWEFTGSAKHPSGNMRTVDIEDIADLS